jgi:hypothetical protein
LRDQQQWGEILDHLIISPIIVWMNQVHQ